MFYAEISLSLVGIGSFLFLFGFIFFFERTMMAIGDIMILAGIFYYIGIETVLKSFTNKDNYKQTISILVGLLLVLINWTILGLIVQIYGMFLLIKNNLANSIFGFMPSISITSNATTIFNRLFSSKKANNPEQPDKDKNYNFPPNSQNLQGFNAY